MNPLTDSSNVCAIFVTNKYIIKIDSLLSSKLISINVDFVL